MFRELEAHFFANAPCTKKKLRYSIGMLLNTVMPQI